MPAIHEKRNGSEIIQNNVDMVHKNTMEKIEITAIEKNQTQLTKHLLLCL